jgi:hypothetical protein
MAAPLRLLLMVELPHPFLGDVATTPETLARISAGAFAATGLHLTSGSEDADQLSQLLEDGDGAANHPGLPARAHFCSANATVVSGCGRRSPS